MPDPIPLPAPVWLFKVLHIATLTLHFAALHALLGGLTLGIVWNLLGRRRPESAAFKSAAALISRLPVVMTYVINLGVPPLLFAQVLYGRALYTSSVLIGTYWISVIFLLMGGYSLLYVAARRAEAGRDWWHVGLASFVLFAYIGRIYVANSQQYKADQAEWMTRDLAANPTRCVPWPSGTGPSSPAAPRCRPSRRSPRCGRRCKTAVRT